MSSKNNVRPGSTNNVRQGSLNNVRGGGLTSTLVWAVALQPVNTTIGGYTAEILGGVEQYPIPSGQSGYPHLCEMISSGLSVASDGTTNSGGGTNQFFYTAENWVGPGATLANSGANPNALWLVTASQPAGLYRGQLSMVAGEYLEFPRAFTPAIKAYISLANNGTGLVQVGAGAGASINLAFNPYFSTLGYSIPEDSISPFLYQFESAGVLGSTANFYTYLSFTGLPGPTYAGLADTGTLQWNGYHLTE